MNGRTLVTLVGETTPGLESNGTRINGLMGEALEYVADGVPLANRQFGGVNLAQTQIPDPDSVQEVRVESTDGGAQYAEPATAILTTKSGTNSLHGTAFETARNNAIGIAKNRNNPANFAAPHYVRNEFGASAGGPIVFPHLYHGKDKSFWFFAYERYSLANPSDELTTVPTVAERGGDFSNYTNTSGQLIQLYDPATTHSDANCNGTGQANPYCRAPFGNGSGVLGDTGNNQIPVSRLSPTFKIIQDITPLPSTADNPVVAGSNLSAVNPTFNLVPTITFRLDQEFNENNRAYLRYTSNVFTSIALRNYTNTGINNPATIAADGFPEWATGVAYNPSASFAGALGFTHVFSPQFFSETIVSQQWLGQHNYAGGTPKADFEKMLGTPNNFGEPGFPQFGTNQSGNGLQNNQFGYGGTQFIYGLSQIVQNLDENLTLTKGKHQLYFGGRYRHERFGDLPDEISDTIAFNGQGTGIYLTSSGSNYSPTPLTGGSDADAFLGAATYYSVTQEPPYAHFHDYEFDAYIQDNYRVSPDVTVNIGLRYEAHPAPWTKYGLYNSFDLKNDAVVLEVPPAKLISEGYTTQAIITNMENIGAKYETPQQAGMPSVLMRNYDFTFGPRLGLAWQPFGAKRGTVIRGAYGRYIYPMPTRSFLKNVIQNNPLVAGYSQSFTSQNQTNDGLPNELLRYPQGGGSWQQSSAFTPIMGVNTGNGIVNSSSTNAILPGVGLWDNAPNMPPDYVTETNFTVEQPLKGNSVLRLTWLWTHGTNLDHYYYINNAPSSFVWEAATGTAVNTANGSIATRPYDTKTWGGNTWDVKNGWSNDNELQANYERLFHNGIAYQIVYVWSKPFRVGGNYFRDGTIDPEANFEGVLGSSGTVSTAPNCPACLPFIAPALPPKPPAGTLPWQEYHALDVFERYMPDTAIPKQHITFNGIVDLPFGRGKKFLGGANRFEDEVIGGWQIAGDGQVVSQDFTITSSNWGPTTALKTYKARKVTDCTGTVCHPEYLWFNGYIAPALQSKVSGLPSNYAPYSEPINPTNGSNNVGVTLIGASSPSTVAYSPGPIGSNPFSKTVLNGPMNYNVDLSVFKVFPIRESVDLRFNADAFNAFNIQGYNNPNGTTGEIQIQPGAGVASSYWTPRQIQLTLRLTF